MGNVKIYFDDKIITHELNGSVLNFESNDINKKKEALKQVLEKVSEFSTMEENSKELKILILVPNGRLMIKLGLVSIIIGTKGKQIGNLIRESNANIVVNQPIYKMLHRTITIQGKISNIVNAVILIHKIMEDRFFEVKLAEIECKPLDLRKTKTSV